MRAYLALFAAAVVLFTMNGKALAGYDEELADGDLNVAAGMTEAEIRELIGQARNDGEPGQVAVRQ